MSDVGAPAGVSGNRPDDANAEQKAQDLGGQAQEMAGQAQEMARDAASKAQENVREQVEQRAKQAGDRVSGTAEDLRSVGEELRKQGKEGPAKIAEQAAERTETVGSYLSDTDPDRILHDVEDFGRRRPMVVLAGGLVAGVVAARFLKASSRSRYRQGSGNGAERQLGRASQPPAPPRESVGAQPVVAEPVGSPAGGP